MTNFKTNKIVRGVFDPQFAFDQHIWKPQDRDRFKLVSTDLPTIALRITPRRMLVMGAADVGGIDNLFEPDTFRGFNNEQREALTAYAGFPIHFSIAFRGEYDPFTATFPTYNVSIAGWINRPNTSGFIEIANYRGETLIMPQKLIRTMNGRNDIKGNNS